MTKTISILGSTGSIGRQTLDVVDQLGIKVSALTCGSNLDRMIAQCKKYKPMLAVMGTKELAERLKDSISDQPTEVMYGMDGLIKAAEFEMADTVITAVVGMTHISGL